MKYFFMSEKLQIFQNFNNLQIYVENITRYYTWYSERLE